jgi:hypothetical protein
MTRARRLTLLEPSSLYPDEAEIARLVLGDARAKDWDGVATVLERKGLPPIDPMMGGRYWPAVRAFLDRRHRLNLDAEPPAPEADENWDEPPSRSRAARPRPQAHEAQHRSR